jgi:hypothetical protein
MDNKRKLEEHKRLLAECRNKGFLHCKPAVHEMEKLKYSDSALDREVCALLEYADELYMFKLLSKTV